MIRDPSDGSVREPKPLESGLPVTKELADEVARIERSREWLKKYRDRPVSSERSSEMGG